MTFRKKAVVLSALAAALALVYILTLVFDPQRESRLAFAWLDPSLLGMADGIEIYGTGGRIVLNRINNIWVFSDPGPDGSQRDLPVKQARVEDFLSVLSRKNIYPPRAASVEARDKLGLGEGSASRILVRGGKGLPLLDLLVGAADALGREVYLKRADKNEIYSGEDHFTLYTESKPGSWYDLRLFPPAATVEAVQQADVTLPGDEAAGPSAFTLRRSAKGWIIPGNESVDLDTSRVDSWLRSVLEAEGEDFASQPPAVVEGSITLRMGDGTAKTLQVGPPDEEKRRSAVISGSSLVYLIPELTLSRLFREDSYFLKTGQ